MLTPPLLWPSLATPAAEVDAIKDLQADLWGVASNVEAWASALRLYQFTKTKPDSIDRDDSRRWMFIASNECVYQLHHLRERIEKIRGHKVRACPSLASIIDGNFLRASTRMLDRYFPDIDCLRHAIAHAGANDVLPEAHASQSGYLLVGFPQPDQYTASYKRVERHLKLTEQSLLQIEEVARKFFEAFHAASKLLQQQGHLE